MKIEQNELCRCGSGIKYKDCCQKNVKEHERAKPDPVMAEVRELLEGRSFNSLEEVNAFLSKHMQLRNASPEGDFDGLSTEQMHRFLYFPLKSPDLVGFPTCLAGC